MFTSRLWLEIQKLVTYEPYLPEKSTSTRKASSKKKKQNKTKNSDAKQRYAFLMFTLYSLKSLINVVYSCTFYTLVFKNLSRILNKMWWNGRHCRKKNKMYVCRCAFLHFLWSLWYLRTEKLVDFCILTLQFVRCKFYYFLRLQGCLEVF